MGKLSKLLYKMAKNKHKLYIGYLCYKYYIMIARSFYFFANTMTFKNAYSDVIKTLLLKVRH